MATTSRQLFLLADHLKLSLLERQRAVALNLDPNRQDPQISRSLSNLQDGLEKLEAQSPDGADDVDTTSDLARLRKQFDDLYAQFHGSAPPSSTLRAPNNSSLQSDFTAAASHPSQSQTQPRRSKSVRFRDNPNAPPEDEDPLDTANRAALFSNTERYTDDPPGPDQSNLDNQQIHAYHKQVLEEQDQQLDVLGQSIGRQRMLGIQMGDELDEQAELLDDVERGVDRHTSTLERARKRLGKVARKSKDNWSWVTIGILICILVLLIIVLK